jgi:REP element-mobilizing transposase RayT
MKKAVGAAPRGRPPVGARLNRQSIRLPGYDYAQPGSYFITLVTQHRFCAFGAVADGRMNMNPIGRMVKTVWDEIPAYYPGVGIDAAVVMPNHFHGIIVLAGAAPRGCPIPVESDGQAGAPAPTIPAKPLSLPDVVHRFKSLTTARYRDGVKQYAWPDFPGHFWQRNYHEHIIRDDAEMARIRHYIANNPIQWQRDRFHIVPR